MSTPHRSSSPLFDYAAMVWAQKWLVLTVVLFLAVPAAIVSFMQAPVYQASSVLALSKPTTTADQSATSAALSDTEMRTQVALVNGDEVQGLARERGASSQVSASLTGSSNILSITAVDSSSAGAARNANTYAQAYVEVRQRQQVAVADAADQQLTERIGAIQRQLADAEPSVAAVLIGQLGNLQTQQLRSAIQKSVAANSVVVVTSAVPPQGPVSPLPVRDGALGAVLGLALGIVVAILLETSTRRRQQQQEEEEKEKEKEGSSGREASNDEKGRHVGPPNGSLEESAADTTELRLKPQRARRAQ